MKPIFLQAGPITLYSYGVFIALAFFAGALVTYRLAKKESLNTGSFIDYFLYAALLGLLGARLWHLAFRPFEVQSLWQVFSLWGGGLALQGGLFMAGVALYLILRRQRQPVWRWFDIITIGTVIGLAIGKFGSFLNGDGFGRSAKLPWAVQFNDPLAPGYIMGTPLHPLQLYGFMAFTLIAAVLIILYRLGRRGRLNLYPGFIFLVGVALLSVTEIGLELWHAPIDSLYINNSIRVVSATALVTLAASAGLLLRNHLKHRPTPRHG